MENNRSIWISLFLISIFTSVKILLIQDFKQSLFVVMGKKTNQRYFVLDT